MSLRQIPLHMLLLAGLIAPAGAADEAPAKSRSAPSAKPASQSPAYAGLNALPPTDEERAALGDRLPAGAGLRVGVVDPDGPAADQLQPGDVLVRLDDQLLVNFDQFRSLVQMRRPGDTVKFSLIRNGATMTVPVRLAVRPAGVEAEDRTRAKSAASADALRHDAGGARTIQIGPGFVINIGPGAAFPPELMQPLAEMRTRGLLASPGVAGARSRKSQVVPEEADKARPGVSTSTSRSFSFGLGAGATSSSKTLLHDAEGTVMVEDVDGKRRAMVKDAQGKVLFEGEIATAEQRAQLSDDVRRRLKAVEGGVFSVPAAPAAPAAPKAPAPAQKFDAKKGA